jgi:tripartite-type tricarboxylate transporter receptor subunit TctC
LPEKIRVVSRRRALVLATSLAAAAFSVQAQTYPSRPVRLMVGFSAGGGVDAMARMLAPRLSALLGQQVVVENRAGAAGLIAGDAVAKAAPDGYTLLLAESSMLIAPHLQARMNFDPVRSFAPVAGLFTIPLMIVANNDFPARNPKELLATLKAGPGKYSYATPGVGTVQHLGFELLKARTGAFVVHVPYRGAAQVVPDVISGQVPLAVVSATAGMTQARAGRLRAIALMSTDKLPGAQDVPVLAEALPGFSATPRLFLMAPAGTPQPVVDRLTEAVRSVLASPELAQAAALQGAAPAFSSGPALVAELARESAQWGEVIRSRKISTQ